jgi:hypothetical protein
LVNCTLTSCGIDGICGCLDLGKEPGGDFVADGGDVRGGAPEGLQPPQQRPEQVDVPPDLVHDARTPNLDRHLKADERERESERESGDNDEKRAVTVKQERKYKSNFDPPLPIFPLLANTQHERARITQRKPQSHPATAPPTVAPQCVVAL